MNSATVFSLARADGVYSLCIPSSYGHHWPHSRRPWCWILGHIVVIEEWHGGKRIRTAVLSRGFDDSGGFDPQ